MSNPDTLTKLKTAAEISQKALAKVKKACIPGANLLQLCQQGDSFLEEETSKVYKGKKIPKGTYNPPFNVEMLIYRNCFSHSDFAE